MKPAVMIVALGAVAGCGKRVDVPPNDSGCVTGAATDVCVANNDNFANFHKWTSFDVTDGGKENGGAVHTNTQLTAYINKLPPKGSTEFPIGTIIIKVPIGGDTATNHTFAGVKRGGDYNAKGAVNWEWFELQHSDTDTPNWLWRGVGPPAGEQYGGDPAVCNGCHQNAKANDFIMADELQLSKF